MFSNNTTLKNIYISQSKEKPATKGPQLRSRYLPMDCGAEHSAVVWGLDLYTWGKNHYCRLGHGNLMVDQIKVAPLRVDVLHTLQTQVLVVACGARHTLALTQKGVS